MTAHQDAILELLELPGEAKNLALLLGIPVEMVYQELVALEAKKIVLVWLEYSKTSITFRGWVAV